MAKFNLTAHRQLWDCVLLLLDQISKTDPDDESSEFYGYDFDDFKKIAYDKANLKKHAYFYCWACEYANRVRKSKKNKGSNLDLCYYCPIKIGLCMGDPEVLYNSICQAYNLRDWEDCKELAAQIRDATVKEGVETY